MACKINLLDCTLRDGAYIVDSHFGEEAIKNIINCLENAGTEIIECGWLKNDEHKSGSSYYHKDVDLKKYIDRKKDKKYYLMIDWNRYDPDFLDKNDEHICDMIRITFPKDKAKEGIEVGKRLIDKGYEIEFQLVNTKIYCDETTETFEFLKKLAEEFDKLKIKHIGLSDTFGAMFPSDVRYIAKVFNALLEKDVSLGLHTHNNMYLAFANSITFIDELKDTEREIFVDSSICGMGRGAGNTPTELLMNYLNKYFAKNYDLNHIYACIDKYISKYHKEYNWGYTAENGIGGINACHINNISYLLEKHGASSESIKKTIDLMDDMKRTKYDYEYLEEKYKTV